MAAELENILNDMKSKGIGGSIIRIDGVPVHSTIALTDLKLLADIVRAFFFLVIMKRMDDNQKEVKISFDGMIMVMVPLKNHIFCGIVKDRDEKKMVLDSAQKAKAYLQVIGLEKWNTNACYPGIITRSSGSRTAPNPARP